MLILDKNWELLVFCRMCLTWRRKSWSYWVRRNNSTIKWSEIDEFFVISLVMALIMGNDWEMKKWWNDKRRWLSCLEGIPYTNNNVWNDSWIGEKSHQPLCSFECSFRIEKFTGIWISPFNSICGDNPPFNSSSRRTPYFDHSRKKDYFVWNKENTLFVEDR